MSKFKTTLPEAINTIPEAKKFLRELYNNGESYHPEDDAKDILWISCGQPTTRQATKLNKLMDDIYNLEGNDGNHATPIFCPCGFLLNEAKVFYQKDLTGRGYNGQCNANILLEGIDEVPEEEGENEDAETAEAREIRAWIESAEEGDEYQTSDSKYIRIS